MEYIILILFIGLLTSFLYKKENITKKEFYTTISGDFVSSSTKKITWRYKLDNSKFCVKLSNGQKITSKSGGQELQFCFERRGINVELGYDLTNVIFFNKIYNINKKVKYLKIGYKVLNPDNYIIS